MRPIKFKAWDEKARKLRDVRAIDFTPQAGEDAGKVWVYFSDAPSILIDPKNLIQFIGRLDKNGREIYKGDLIRWPEGAEGVWSDQAGKVEEVRYPFVCGNAHLCEVIGNIHETPELLSAPASGPAKGEGQP